MTVPSGRRYNRGVEKVEELLLNLLGAVIFLGLIAFVLALIVREFV